VPRVELDLDELRDRLAPVGVDELGRLPGGASSLTYEGRMAGDSIRRVVVKVAPAGVPPVLNRDVLRQARVLRALRPTAVPVPEVLWEDAGDPPNVPPLFVMSFVAGTALEPLFDRDGDDEEAVVAERMRNAVRVLAELHAVPPDRVDLDPQPAVGLSEEVDRWCRLLETVDPALAPRWPAVADALRAGEPRSGRVAVVHGDFRLGNMLAVGSHIQAIIDWEIWSMSDPRLDVGWFLLNADPDTYGRATRYSTSLQTPTELTRAYTETRDHDVADLGWFQALAGFKAAATWALIIKHNRRRDTPDPAVENVAAALPRLLGRAAELASGER
jgi:aminoglycoside phosphotransferase (APT) family kinase protein